jgi:tetratricopeptide (TPR) repeat protein
MPSRGLKKPSKQGGCKGKNEKESFSVINNKQIKQKLNKFAQFSPLAEPLTFKKALLLFCYVEGIWYAADWFFYRINLYNGIMSDIIHLAAVLMAAREMGKGELSRILAWRNIPLAVFASVMVMFSGFEIVTSELRNLFEIIFPIPDSFFDGWYYEQENFFLEIVSMSLFPGFTEEIFFRGILAYGFFRVYSLRKAILLSALLFGLAHMNIWQAVNCFYAGIFYGWLYWRYKSIWLCMFLHAYNNALWSMPFGFPYVQNEYYEYTHHPVWFDLLGLLLFCVGLLSVIVLNRKGNTDKENAEIIKTRNINRAIFDKEKAAKRAIAECTFVIERVPDDAFTYVKRGWAYSDKKDYDKAIADYTKAINLKPDYTYYYISRGDAHHRKKDYHKAVADYTQAIELDPNYALAYNNRGRAHYRKGDYDKAIADYEEALKINPNDADAKQGLEKAKQARGGENAG